MGVDAPLAEAAPGLVRKLLAGLSRHGIRPAKVVCNGVLLFESAAHESAATASAATGGPVAPHSPP
jgi:hypothetical protein